MHRYVRWKMLNNEIDNRRKKKEKSDKSKTMLDGIFHIHKHKHTLRKT